MFSVIMPCYNSEEYVNNAVESLMRQSWPNWELIAVNDGSKDNTLSILQKYAETEPRIRIYSKENGGYVSAVNVGLDHIRGDYFLMMGSDDALAPDLFEKLASGMGDQRPGCIAFQTELFRDGVSIGIEPTTQFQGEVAEYQTTLADLAEKYPSHSEIFFTRDTSKCYHRRLLGDLRYFGHYGLDADGIFSMLLCHNSDSFLVMPISGYYWSIRKNSLSGRERTVELNSDCISNWIRYYTEVNSRGDRLAETEKQYLFYLLRLVQAVAEQGGRQEKSLIREASKVILETAARVGYRMDLCKKDWLLLRSYDAWKLMNRFLG